ncbi:hypothetical protein CYL15_07855 [Geobacillus thermodenitrificans]|nr:hypothetical protein [Geobacillus thermodenitrificans]
MAILFSCILALAAKSYTIHLGAPRNKMNHKGVHKGCYILHKGYYMIFKGQSQYFNFLLCCLYDIIKDEIFRKNATHSFALK